MEDTLSLFEQQIERLLDAVIKLKAEKKQLLEANEALQKQVQDLQNRVEELQNEVDELSKSAQGGQMVQERLDSLLSRINKALGET